MKNRFDFEQEIMGVWNIIEELKVLHEGVLERRSEEHTSELQSH